MIIFMNLSHTITVTTTRHVGAIYLNISYSKITFYMKIIARRRKNDKYEPYNNTIVLLCTTATMFEFCELFNHSFFRCSLCLASHSFTALGWFLTFGHLVIFDHFLNPSSFEPLLAIVYKNICRSSVSLYKRNVSSV